MDINENVCAEVQARVRELDWAAAFASRDPARQWAASCSIARVVTSNDSWADSTVLQEAAVGAFDAVTESCARSAVALAVLGARRAAQWEREARVRLVPPASHMGHRWRSDERACRRHPTQLQPIDEQTVLAAQPRPVPRPPSRVAPWLGAALHDAGWRWQPAPDEAVEGAIDVIADVGRDAAPREIRQRYPGLPCPVVNNLVLLLAGSRMRDGLGWQGVVWLEAHHGRRAAETDRGTQSVIRALIAERRGRPINSVAETNRAHVAEPIPLRRLSTARRQPARENLSRAVAS
ncbi:MAG: hypothetical protein BGO26_06690 [Actinobacteria bacterium 69-20]|nr:hypothetical protein [Actinomycetota bacterium]OJV28122.1 MAG: hypothetical protein BGO26_06690 [Actinobacteria bacterium 69-20]